MKYHVLIPLLSILAIINTYAQDMSNQQLPVRGFAISAPSPAMVDSFVNFIDHELAPAHFNLIILRVDCNYAYESHPELRDSLPLTKADIKKIVNICKIQNIRIIPQINLLGHQSWASYLGNLLKVYPEFDETPHVKMPKEYKWPNTDGLYCKSYCPLHPDVHKVVFGLVDEIMDVFETNDFHAGMDEVFYIGDDKCPRCSGRDKAKLYADEVTKIQNHLAKRNGRLYIWGDRLIDGKTTGCGMWEASMNNTHRAIDMIPKNVFICDWHYERPDMTPVYFAMKGFDVATCVWRKPDVIDTQFEDIIRFRKQSPPEMSDRFQGIIQTIWSPVDSFIKAYYSKDFDKKESETAGLKILIEKFKDHDKRK